MKEDISSSLIVISFPVRTLCHSMPVVLTRSRSAHRAEWIEARRIAVTLTCRAVRPKRLSPLTSAPPRRRSSTSAVRPFAAALVSSSATVIVVVVVVVGGGGGGVVSINAQVKLDGVMLIGEKETA